MDQKAFNCLFRRAPFSKNPLLKMTESETEQYHKETIRLTDRFFSGNLRDNEPSNVIERIDWYVQYLVYQGIKDLEGIENVNSMDRKEYRYKPCPITINLG